MIRIRTAFLGVLLSLVGLIAAAQTVDVGGAKFDETIDVRGTKLILNGGFSSSSFFVTVNGDTTVEANETFFVNLSAPGNATIARRHRCASRRRSPAMPPARAR